MIAARGIDWFFHVLALALGGRSVAEWKALLTQSEVESWISFYNAHPFDDYHRFHRPAALVASAAHGADIGQLLGWLKHDAPAVEGYSEAELNTFKAFGVTPPRKL